MRKLLKTVSILSLAFGAYVLGNGIVRGISAARVDPAAIVAAEMAREPLRSISVGMLAYFPEELARLRAAMTRAAVSGDMDEAERQVMQAEFRAITGPVLGLLASAGDGQIVPLFDDQIALLRRLSADPLACGRVVVSGMSAEVVAHPLMAGHDLGIALDRLYRTLFLNRFATVQPAPATEADYQAFGTLLAATDLTDADFAALEAGDPADPRLCGAAITTMQVLRDADFPGAVAVRREIMLEMHAG